MATVRGMTAEKILELLDETVVSGEIDEDTGNLILTLKGGSTINAGQVTSSDEVINLEVLADGTLEITRFPDDTESVGTVVVPPIVIGYSADASLNPASGAYTHAKRFKFELWGAGGGGAGGKTSSEGGGGGGGGYHCFEIEASKLTDMIDIYIGAAGSAGGAGTAGGAGGNTRVDFGGIYGILGAGGGGGGHIHASTQNPYGGGGGGVSVKGEHITGANATATAHAGGTAFAGSTPGSATDAYDVLGGAGAIGSSYYGGGGGNADDASGYGRSIFGGGGGATGGNASSTTKKGGRSINGGKGGNQGAQNANGVAGSAPAGGGAGGGKTTSGTTTGGAGAAGYARVTVYFD